MRGVSPGGAAFVAAMVLAIAPVVRSQEALAFGGVSARAGAVFPERADAGFGWAIEVDLGHLRTERLRVLFGVQRFGADVDRQVSGSPVGGSYTATGIHGGVRLDLFASRQFTPYLGTTILAHNVSADVPDAGTDELLDGVYIGATLGGGLGYALDQPGTFSLTAEVRRAFISNIGHWAFEGGIRYLPGRGRGR